MIESAKFKKMLHTLDVTSTDNVNICIVGYDTAKECDYEVITLHLKETNKQNGAFVYKDFVIRSQLYYDETDNKYYSALDGDVIAKDKAFSQINILTTITEDTFSNDDISLTVQLLDESTQEPIKNQPIYMYLNALDINQPDEYIMVAYTNKQGEAIFNFHLSNLSVILEKRIMYFKYLGNKIYEKTQSDYITVDFHDIQDKDLESNITTCVTTDGFLRLKYNVTFNNKNLLDGFDEYTNLSVSEQDVLKGNVLFYIWTRDDRRFLGQGQLTNAQNNTYSAIDVILPSECYNQDIDIQAVFEGNTLFMPDTASLTTRLDRATATNQLLDVLTPFGDEGFQTKLTFEVDLSSLDIPLCEAGFGQLSREFGQVKFYLKNNEGEWGTIEGNLPFYIANNLISENVTDELYEFSTETDYLSIDKSHYLLPDDFSLEIKAVFSGNALINGFEIDNSEPTESTSQR